MSDEAAARAGKPAIEVRDLGIYFRLQGRRRMGMKQLLLGQVRRSAPVIWALREVSFSCDEGQIVGIVGPNGAGKSTLCLALSQILTPDEGTVEVDGKVSTLLTLGAGFNRDLTGRENIYLNAAFLGIPRPVIEDKIDGIIAFSELGEFIDQPTRFYSSGMRSRLGFAVASSLDPEILILDEVLSVGDRRFRRKSQERMEAMMSKSKAILIVSHSTVFLRSLCTHCVWLEKGRLRGFGPAAEILDAYEAASGGPADPDLESEV